MKFYVSFFVFIRYCSRVDKFFHKRKFMIAIYGKMTKLAQIRSIRETADCVKKHFASISNALFANLPNKEILDAHQSSL